MASLIENSCLQNLPCLPNKRKKLSRNHPKNIQTMPTSCTSSRADLYDDHNFYPVLSQSPKSMSHHGQDSGYRQLKYRKHLNPSSNTNNNNNVLRSSLEHKQISKRKFTKKQSNYLKKHANKDDVMTMDAKTVKRRLSRAYTIQAIFRVVLECAFGYVQYYAFPLTIPHLYKCQGHPCPNVVDCFISRPQEKTLISRILFGVTMMSCTVAFLDLYYLGYRRILKAFERKKISNDVDGKLMGQKELENLINNVGKQHESTGKHVGVKMTPTSKMTPVSGLTNLTGYSGINGVQTTEKKAPIIANVNHQNQGSAIRMMPNSQTVPTQLANKNSLTYSYGGKNIISNISGNRLKLSTNVSQINKLRTNYTYAGKLFHNQKNLKNQGSFENDQLQDDINVEILTQNAMMQMDQEEALQRGNDDDENEYGNCYEEEPQQGPETDMDGDELDDGMIGMLGWRKRNIKKKYHDHA